MVEQQKRIISFVLASFAVVVLAVLVQQPFDGVLAVEEFRIELDQASTEAKLPNLDLLPALVYAESRGNENSVSSIGALGLCQVLPSTAAEIADKIGLPDAPWDAAQNLQIGAHYLAQLLGEFEGDLDLAILGYRLGPARVSKSIVEAGSIESYKDSLRQRKPSSWEYRTQILRFAERFRERREAFDSNHEPS